MGPGGPQSAAANSALMAQMMSTGAIGSPLGGGPGYPGMLPTHGNVISCNRHLTESTISFTFT